MCYGIIYKIENKINGKIYIGQTTKKSFDERYGGDIEKNTHNKHLRNSIKKYGIENFVIDKCICECESKEELNETEKFYIDYFNTMDQKHGYNKREGGNGGKLSEETKEKLSESIKKALADPETKKKMSEAKKGKYCGEKNSMYGKHHSEETKQKISAVRKGKYCGEKNSMYGKHHSEESKQKISEAHKGKTVSEEVKKKISGKNNLNARAIVQLDKNGSFIRKWDCINDAIRELNINGIGACCRGKIKSSGGYKWIYLEDYLDLLQYAF